MQGRRDGKWAELRMNVSLSRRIREARGVLQADPGRCKWRERKDQALRQEHAWCSSSRAEDLMARDGHSSERGARRGGSEGIFTEGI